MPIDYTKGKIYKIMCNETGEQYFGSTVQSLNKRIAEHRAKKNECSSKQIIDRGNYQIILCENFACNNKEELLARERKWIDENECVNKKSPILSEDELNQYRKKYRENNKDIIKAYKQLWYYENKQKLQEKYKLYYDENKEQIKEKQLNNYHAKRRFKLYI
jgi:hypothetical protein